MQSLVSKTLPADTTASFSASEGPSCGPRLWWDVPAQLNSVATLLAPVAKISLKRHPWGEMREKEEIYAYASLGVLGDSFRGVVFGFLFF